MITFPHFDAEYLLQMLKKTSFFNYYLAVPWQTLGHSRENSLAYLNLTT